MKKWLITLLVLLASASPALADGPETATISGRVTAAGAAAPGLTVTLESDAGTKTAVTDGNGRFRFALLRPGSHTLKAELEEFAPFERRLSVSAGDSASVDIGLRVETSEVITVTSEAPAIDKFEVSAGATLQTSVAEEVTSTNSNYYETIQLLPGVTGDGRENGGERPSVNGMRWQEGGVFVDGVDTTFSRYGASRIFLPSVATTEISLSGTTSSNAEFGRYGGGVTNIITKSGTNKLHGDFVFSGGQEKWNSEWKSQQSLEDLGVGADFLKRTPEEKEQSQTQAQFGLGGPIVRDKLWYFVSASETVEPHSEVTSTGDVIDNSRYTDAYVAKLNAQPGAKHSVAASYISTPQKDDFTLDIIADRYGPTRREFEGDLVSLSWNYSASSSLFFETKIARQTSDENKFLAVGDGLSLESAIAVKEQDPRYGPRDPSLGPHAPVNTYSPYFVLPGLEQYNGWYLDNGYGLNQFPRDQANVKATLFATEAHELAFGIDYQKVKWDQRLMDVDTYVGGTLQEFDAFSPTGFRPRVAGAPGCGIARGQFCLYRDLTPAELIGTQQTDRGTTSENTSLYARDRITAGDHWGFNVGLRLSNQKHENDVGRTVIDANTVEPRIAVSYDVNANGHLLIKASAGRTHQQIGQDLTNNALIEGWNGTNASDRFLYCDSLDRLIIRACGGRTGYNYLYAQVRPNVFYDLVDSGLFDVDITPYYKDEALLGLEWNFTSTWVVDAKLIWTEVKNFVGSTEQKLPDGNLFVLTENIEDYPRILSAIGKVPQSVIDNFEQPRREYLGLQLQLNRRYRNGWALYNNLTIQDSKSSIYGNIFFNTVSDYGRNLDSVLTEGHIESCETARAGFDEDPNLCREALTPHLGEPLSTINRYGRNPYNHDVTFKSFGYRTWELGRHDLSVGGSLWWESGRPWERTQSLGIAAEDDGSPQQNEFDTTVDVFLEERGANELDSLLQADLFVTWDFPVRSNLRGSFRVEVENVTNEQKQRTADSFGRPRASRFSFTDPRRYRASISLRF